MSSTIVKHESRLPVSIGEMDSGYFWSRPDALGLPDHVAAALDNGSADPDQFLLARDKMLEAKAALADAEGYVPLVSWRPS